MFPPLSTTTSTIKAPPPKSSWMILTVFFGGCFLISIKFMGLKDDTIVLFQGTSKRFHMKILNNSNRSNGNNNVTKDNATKGIPLLPLLEFINQSAGPLPSGQLYPDCLYIIESESLPIAVSSKDNHDDNTTASIKTTEQQQQQQRHSKISLRMSMNGYWKHKTSFRRRKLTPDLDLLTNTIKELQSYPDKYPRLQKAIFEQEEQPASGGGGFPLLINWDPRITRTASSSFSNADGDKSHTSFASTTSTFIPPIFRQVSSVTSSASLFFPIATSSSHVDNRGFPRNDLQWNQTQQRWKMEYPWNTKLQKALLVSIHDGDDIDISNGNTTRTSLIMEQILKSENQQPEQQDSNTVFYTKTMRIQQNDDLDAKSRTIFRMEEQKDEEFLIQNVSAIVVVDGNKGLLGLDSQKLLCLNSILILMVEKDKHEQSHPNTTTTNATQEDMYFPSTIEPWKHYIPLVVESFKNNDYSKIYHEMVNMLKYVHHPDNVNQILNIIQNANQWCQTHMSYSVLTHHLLMQWTRYLEELDRADSNWSSQWNQHKEEYLAGHFLKSRDAAYTITPQIVGKMKGGYRRDEFHGDCQLINECDV